jgi:hypothetical protein
MAEEAKDLTNKRDLLQISIRHLESAIERFSRSPEFGPEHPEVGDCYSLLGRTYLVSGARSDARRAVRKASTLIPPSGAKDYLDLRILEGELLEADDRVAALSGKRVARRSEPSPEYWGQLIKEARARVAVESVKW